MDNENHLSWHCDRHTASELYRRRFDGAIGQNLVRRQNELLLSLLGDMRGRRVLDVGAGHGQLAGAFLSAGASVTAYGSTRAALARIEPLRVTCATGPLYPLPFENRAFDIVVSVRTFSHVPEWRIFFKELCRISGDLVAFDFVPLGGISILKPVIYRLKAKGEPGTRDYTEQRERKIIKAAAEEGYSLKGCEREFVLPMVFHRKAGTALLPLEYIARRIKLTKWWGGPGIMVLERKQNQHCKIHGGTKRI